MPLPSRSLATLAFTALLAGCANHPPAPPAGASASIQCRDGQPFTEKGGCAGQGGIDRQASAQKAQDLRRHEASGTAAAGAPGEVWAMPATKTYACRNDPDYGRAGEGQYMTEAQARDKGLHPAAGCGQ